MTCHSSRVPITPMSVIQVTTPTRRKRRQAPRYPPARASCRGPQAPRSKPATEMTPSTIAASFSTVGVVMNRVSTSMRADSPGWAATFEVGEDTGDLRLLLRREGAGGAGNPDEVGADLPDVGPDVQRAAGARGHRGALGHRGHGVAERDEHHVGGCADEQAALRDVAGFFRHGGQDQAALGGQRGDGLAGDRDVEGLRSTRHQRGGDVGDHAVRAGGLRPGDGGGGLLDRQQRDQGTQQHPGDARDYGDEPGDGVNPRPLRLVAWHEGRC